MRRAFGLAALALLALLSSATGPRGDENSTKPPPAVESALDMTPAVACASIRGFEDYETLPGASLTSDEKLLVYYRPLNYRIEAKGSARRIHLTQDGQVRRKGEKGVLLAKANLLDYDWKGREPVLIVYLQNTFSLKGLKPGEYEYDIALHDKLAPGEPVARQSLAFRVVPPGARDGKGEVKPSEDRPTPP